jgi:hypothetical protein
MFCAPEHVFNGTEGVWSRFHVLRARTNFRRKQGRRVPFSSFALLESFPAVSWVSCPVFMFCAPGLDLVGTKGDNSRINVLRAQTRFPRYRERRVKFSCFAIPDSFSAVSTATGSVFMFCAPRLIFGGNKGVGYHFQILRARTHFRRCRVRWVPFSCFARPDSFSAIPRVLGPVFMFCARTHFLRYQGRQLPFSYFALPNSFSAIPRASAPFLMFCAPGPFFGGTEGVGSRFHVLRARTHFRRYRERRVKFSFFFCSWTHFFVVSEVVGSCFLVLRAWTRFRRYRVCRLAY